MYGIGCHAITLNSFLLDGGAFILEPLCNDFGELENLKETKFAVKWIEYLNGHLIVYKRWSLVLMRRGQS